MTQGLIDPTNHDGPAGAMAQMAGNPKRYREIPPLPERGKGQETRIARDKMDMNELYKEFGYSRPIAEMAEGASKYGGFLKDGHVTDDLEKAVVLDSLGIHRMIITSECVLRKARYAEEEAVAQQRLSDIAPHRRPNRNTFDPYMLPDDDAVEDLWKDYLASLESEDDAEDEELPEEEPALPARRGRPRRERTEAPDALLPTVEELLHKWGAADAFMFKVLIEEELHGLDHAEQYYDEYERIERIRQDVEFTAAMLPPAEHAFFWCRVRQMQITRERSYDIAMGFPIADYSDALADITAGRNIHDVAHTLDWSFGNAYARVSGSMMDGTEYRTTLTGMVAQQVPLTPQLLQAMSSPPPGYWQGAGQGAPWGDGSGQEGQGQPEGKPDRRGAIFNLMRNNGGAQPQQNAAQGSNRRRRRARSS